MNKKLLLFAAMAAFGANAAMAETMSFYGVEISFKNDEEEKMAQNEALDDCFAKEEELQRALAEKMDSWQCTSEQNSEKTDDETVNKCNMPDEHVTQERNAILEEVKNCLKAVNDL